MCIIIVLWRIFIYTVLSRICIVLSRICISSCHESVYWPVINPNNYCRVKNPYKYFLIRNLYKSCPVANVYTGLSWICILKTLVQSQMFVIVLSWCHESFTTCLPATWRPEVSLFKFSVAFRPQRPRGEKKKDEKKKKKRTISPGRPLPLSHSFWALWYYIQFSGALRLQKP